MSAEKSLCVRKRRLLDYLTEKGKPYTARVIDREPVVYTRLDDYDIEISGGSYQRPFWVYVWALNKAGRPLCTVCAITVQSEDIPSAAKEIENIAEEYRRKPAYAVSV